MSGRSRAVLAVLHVVFLFRSQASMAAGDIRLVDAVRHKDFTTARALLRQGVDVNVTQADGATALHWAVHWDDTVTVDSLIRAGARVDAANELGVTALTLACENPNAALVARLLRAGASPNARHGSRPPDLMVCAKTGSVDGATALVAAGADVNAKEPLHDQTALMWAVAGGHADLVRVLLDRGADVDARSRVTHLFVNRANPNDVLTAVIGDVSQGGSTPLLFAARHGDVASTALLLNHGANVNAIAADGASALIVAALSNQEPLVAFLLDRGANPNIIGAGYTALHAAVLRGNAALVAMLVARGANVNARIRHGTPTTRGTRDYFLPESLTGATPFLLAAKFLEIGIMRALTAAGANPQITLADGTTALMAAAGVPATPPQFDRRDRVAAIGSVDDERGGALDAVRTALELGGGQVNAANDAGDTALHGAAARGYTTVIQLLLQRGAERDVRNKIGKTPIDVANGQHVIQLLRESRSKQ